VAASDPHDHDARPPAARPQLWVVLGLLAAAALVVAVLVLRQDRPPVVLLGDSITAGLRPAVRSELRSSYSVELDGRPSNLVAQQLAAAENASRFPFTQVVINLGTNDVMTAGQDLDASLGSIEQMVALFPDADCIHLVTVNEQMVKDGVDATGRADRFNDGLAGLATTDERIRIIDWSEMVGSYEADNAGEMLTTDTVHPNQSGNALLAGAYKDALDACG
jgi:lysophospholipase L1-like esterase